jgi:sRNA-binding carbon storage regulator CsrA
MDNSYLVLTRKSGDSLTLNVPHPDGSSTTINIDWLEKSGKVGIEAPREVEVIRAELLNR